MHEKGMTWDAISAELGIFTEDGRVDPGLAYRMVMEGYVPKKIETQIRVGMIPVCPTCHRTMPGYKRRRRKDLFGLSAKEIRRRFEERQDV